MSRPTIKLLTDDSALSDTVVIGGFERSDPDLGRFERRLGHAVAKGVARAKWKGKLEQVVRSTTRGVPPSTVELHGLGPLKKFDSRRLGIWLTGALEKAQNEGRRELTLVLPDHSSCRGRNSLAILRTILLLGYRFASYRQGPGRTRLRTVLLMPPKGEDEIYRRALPLARDLSRAVAWSRDLGNTPPNEATPDWMAQQAATMASERGIDCHILGPAELAENGMGGILAVGQGSANPPRLVRLEWGEGDQTTAFVGKGVTFDTGGISIKPSNGMEEMKYDKCGACAVLGIVRAAVDMGLPGRYLALLPFVENMPDGTSYRPGDIVRCHSGKTVEILDTDAEGRLILADALSLAASEKPQVLLEYSTLTGAAVVALGSYGAALYTPDDELCDELNAAAISSGERIWRMPLWPEFTAEMEGVHADLRNLGGRWGGANTAAAFLAAFTGRVLRWAHLDIAGTAYSASREAQQSGATGFGVALTLDWMLAKADAF